MNNVILICGESGSGKTELANFIKEYLDNRTGTYLDVTLVRGNAQSVKDKATKQFNWNGVKDKKGRQLLIDITDEGYARDKFYWENETFTEAIMHKEFTCKTCDYLVIPDWRYSCTLEYFKNRMEKVIAIKVVRPSRKQGTHDSHSSENNFKDFEIDMEVYNTKDLDYLKQQAKIICDKML